MSVPIFIGLGAAALLGVVIRKAEQDARTAIDLGCRCRDPKISMGGGRAGLG